jgi:predicted Zn-dependent protease
MEDGKTVKPKVTIQSHFFPFIPSCVFPTHTMAVAVFTTGPGPVQVQFHGTNVWSSSSVCPYESCGWEAYADMSTGDEIWLYSVTAGISNHVSNWCGSIAK